MRRDALLGIWSKSTSKKSTGLVKERLLSVRLEVKLLTIQKANKCWMHTMLSYALAVPGTGGSNTGVRGGVVVRLARTRSSWKARQMIAQCENAEKAGARPAPAIAPVARGSKKVGLLLLSRRDGWTCKRGMCQAAWKGIIVGIVIKGGSVRNGLSGRRQERTHIGRLACEGMESRLNGKSSMILDEKCRVSLYDVCTNSGRKIMLHNKIIDERKLNDE